MHVTCFDLPYHYISIFHKYVIKRIRVYLHIFREVTFPTQISVSELHVPNHFKQVNDEDES